MARPASIQKAKTGHRSNEEKVMRQAAEDVLRGDGADVEPPKHLSAAQKKIFCYIRDHLKDVNVVGSLDVYMIAEVSVTIQQIIDIDRQLKKRDLEIPERKSLITMRSGLMKDFYRGTGELAMSPQARAKLSIVAADIVKEKTKSDPIDSILSELDDDGD